MLRINNPIASLFWLFFLLITTSLNAQNFTSPTMNISGDVTKIFEAEYQVSKRKSAFTFEKEEFQTGSITKISANKQFLEHSSYYNEKTILADHYYTIDSQNKYTSGEAFGLEAQKRADIKFEYNKDNQLESIQFIGVKDKQVFSTRRFYYKNGKQTKTTLTVKNMRTNEQFKYEHLFEKGLVTEVRKLNEADQLVSTQKNEYNKNGDPIKHQEFSADGTLMNVQTFEYQYDDKGNYITCLLTDHNEDVMTLIKRNIIYKNKKTKLNQKDLVGFWRSWGQGMVVEFKNDGKSEVTSKENRRGAKNRYSYSPFSEELELGIYPHSKDKYSVEQNGKFLSLYGIGRNSVILHLEKMPLPKTSKEYFAQLHEVDLSGTFRNKGLKSYAGKEIYPEKYLVSPLTDKCLSIANDKLRAIGDFKGKLKTDFIYSELKRMDSKHIRAKKDGKYGIIDAKGKVIVPFEYGKISGGEEGFFWAYENRGSSHYPILMSADGSPPRPYHDIRQLKYNRRRATSSGNKRSYEWLDQNYNKVKTVQEVGYVSPISFNRFMARTKDGLAVIDSMGATVFPLDTDKIKHLNGRLFEIEKNDKFGILDTDGTALTKTIYDELLNPHTVKKGISTAEFRSQKAALIYRRGDNFGLLTGLGKEQNFSLPTLIDNKHFYKSWGNKDIFELKHSFYWTPAGYGNALKYKGMDYVEASFSYNIIPIQGGSFENAVSQSMSQHNLTGNRVAKKVDGHDAYSIFTHLPAPQGRNNFIRKDIFVKANDNQLIHFSVSTGNAQIIYLVYELFILEETIDILD